MERDPLRVAADRWRSALDDALMKLYGQGYTAGDYKWDATLADFGDDAFNLLNDFTTGEVFE
jgi:predicted GNAT superfamily acetyltransferase